MLEFEWDDAKAAANFRKHGVTFEQAAYAFRDPFAVEWIDERAAYSSCQKFFPIAGFLNPPKSPFFKGGLSKQFR